MAVWGILPAAGAGSRMQPLAFSKELLPVGSRTERDAERPRAVSESLVERLIVAGATRLCFVIAPARSDILEYYGGAVQDVPVCYVVQDAPAGLCGAVFCAAPLAHPGDHVLIGLPDTVWFPVDALRALPADRLGLLLFPVRHPDLFDAVITDEDAQVSQVQVKKPDPDSHWIRGAMGMPAGVFHTLHDLWRERHGADQYLGSLINADLAPPAPGRRRTCRPRLRGRGHARRVPPGHPAAAAAGRGRAGGACHRAACLARRGRVVAARFGFGPALLRTSCDASPRASAAVSHSRDAQPGTIACRMSQLHEPGRRRPGLRALPGRSRATYGRLPRWHTFWSPDPVEEA